MSVLSTVLGIAVGALLTYLFTRSQEREKSYRVQRAAAYGDYLRGVAEAAHLSLQSDEPALFARVADAKMRICLYGSKDVIALLAAFEREGGALGSPHQRHSFIRLVQAMRTTRADQNTDFEVILFKDTG